MTNTLINKKLKKEQQEGLVEGKMLPIMEEFYSVQGEGYNTGKAAYFIRVGGCDVGCHWCDVKESWNPDLHPLVDVQQIIENIIKIEAKAIVITGGEPLLYNLDYITNQLKAIGVEVFLETSGAHQSSGSWDWYCLSPKKNIPPLDDAYHYADELKVIIHNKNDFKWAEEHAAKVKKHCRLYLQPEWSSQEKMLPLIIEYVKKHTQWSISLQTHKYMHIP